MDRIEVVGIVVVLFILIFMGLSVMLVSKDSGVNQFIKQFCNSNKAITLEQHQRCIWRMEEYK